MVRLCFKMPSGSVSIDGETNTDGHNRCTVVITRQFYFYIILLHRFAQNGFISDATKSSTVGSAMAL